MNTKDTMDHLPNNDAWIARFKALREFHDTHERLPRANRNGGPEDTLHTWLQRQRGIWAADRLPANLATILRMVPGTLTVRIKREMLAEAASAKVPAEAPPVKVLPFDRSESIEEFHREHGRLPRQRGGLQGERALYRHLCDVIRVKYRSGELEPDVLQRMESIPGALTTFTRRAA